MGFTRRYAAVLCVLHGRDPAAMLRGFDEDIQQLEEDRAPLEAELGSRGVSKALSDRA